MLSRLWLTLSIIIALSALGPGPAVAQQNEHQQVPYGMWMTEDEESRVEIFPCGDAMCGRVAWMQDGHDEDGNVLTDVHNPNPDLRTVPVLGLIIMTDIRPTGDDGVWRGEVYNPQDGRTYDFWLTAVSQSEITIEGCGLYNLVCQTHTWSRVDPASVLSAKQQQ